MSRWFGTLAVVALVATGCGGSGPPPPTVRVDRGEVISAVDASGSLVAVNEQKLGFGDGGRVTEVLVRVGDRVEPGQVLARLDDRALRDTLAERQASLAEQQAVLGRIRGDNAVGEAGDSLGQAREILEATEDEAEETNRSNRSASERARAQLDVEQDARRLAEDQLRAARAACPPTGTCDTSAAESAVQQAEGAVVSARTQVEAAEQQERTGAAAGDVSVENARQGVVSAQNERDAAASDRPFNVDEQEALVADARAGVAAAGRDVAESVLTAPVGGVVSAINGVPGEFVPAPSAVTAQAPGGRASIPDSATATATTTGPPGSGAFVVLTAADAFELVVPFEESDAVQLVVGQQVDITVDAVPDPVLRGRVLAIAPTGTQLNGIVSFYVTISIEAPGTRLRNGMTAEASVRTQVAENVLRVPNSAVGRAPDGRPSVTITGPDGDPVTVPFEPGLVGNDFTEVRSGLQSGQDVRLPQATVTFDPNEPQGGPGDGG